MSTVKDLGGNISGLSDWFTVLELSFPNLANALTGVKESFSTARIDMAMASGAAEKAQVAFAGLRGATSSLWGVIAAHPIMSAVVAFTALYAIVNAVNKAAEDARQAIIENADKEAEKTSEAAVERKKEVKEIDNLIEAYKKLKTSETFDGENREKIRDIQQQITKLVGSEADNLDLVNGKLSEQEDILRSIAKKRAESAKEAAQEAIYAANDSAVANIHRHVDKAVEYENDYTSGKVQAILANSGIRGRTLGWQDGQLEDKDGVFSDLKQLARDYEMILANEEWGHQDMWLMWDDDVPVSKLIEGMDDMLDYYRKNVDDHGNSTHYQKLLEIRDGLVTQQEKVESQVENLLNADNSLYGYLDRDINSLEEYKDLRQEAIDRILNDDSVSESVDLGILSEDAVGQMVDELLAGADNYYEYMVLFKKGITEAEQKAEQIPVDYFNELMNEEGTSDSPSFVDRVEDSVDKIQELKDALKDLQAGTLTPLEKASLIESFPQLAEYANDFGNGISTITESMRQNVIDEFTKQISKLKAKGATDEDIQKVIAYRDVILEAIDDIVDESNAFDTAKDEFDALTSALSTVKTAFEELNEQGALSASTIESLLSLEPEYLNLLTNEQGQLDLTSESYEKLIKAKMTEMLLSKMQSAFDDILSLGVEEAAACAAADAYDVETASILDLIKAKMELSLQTAAEQDAANNTDVYTKAIFRLAESYTPLIEAIDNWSLEMENADEVTDEATEALNNQKDALEAQKDALEDQKEALEDAKDALEDYKDELEDAQSAMNDLVDTVVDYIKHQKEAEKSDLEDKKDKAREAIEARKEAFDDLIEAEKEELEVKKEAADFERTLREKENSVAKNALAASIASLDNSAAGRKAAKEANDALASSRDDLYQELADHEYDLEVDRLDKLKELKGEAYDKEAEDSDARYDAQIKKLEDYLANERQIRLDAYALIENDTGDLYGKLWEYTYENTTKTKAEFDNMWTKAQTVIEKYDIKQHGVASFMETIQTEIYITETKIDSMDKAIDGVSKAIDGVETAIDSVSDRIDTMSNTTLSTFTTKINGIRDAYKQMLAEMEAEEENKKWHFVWSNGTDKNVDFWSSAKDQDQAINDIKAQLAGRWGWSMYDGSVNKLIRNNMKRYAKGTLSALGGFSEVNEEGHEIRILNKGDGILTAKITKNLSNLGSNPVQFLADAGKELLSKISGSTVLGNLIGRTPALAAVSSSSDMPITIVNHINGDVNPSTLKALEKAQKQITDNAINGVFKKTLGLRNSSRVR